MTARSGSRLAHTLFVLPVLVLVAGCDGGETTGDDLEPVVAIADGNLSGADMSGFDSTGHLGATGGSVELPDGTAVYVVGGGTVGDATVGLRAVDAAPAGDWEGVAVSGWTEVAVSTLDFDASPAFPVLLEVPANPPAEAVGHPGLRLMTVFSDGLSYPIDGVFDEGTGHFWATITALPAGFMFAVTFDDAIQRLDSADVPDAPGDSSVSSALVEAPWSTLDFVIDFNGQRISMEQARKVARVARNAARIYSAAGFAEPFLYKDTGVVGERWHIHLTDKGSNFDGNANPASADEAARFGRLFVSTSRIDSPKTQDFGSVQAAVAHEMFHAIFASYDIPFASFTYQSNGRTWAYHSSTGFNEGAATAVGYAIDQGEPKPRPSEWPLGLYMPLGYFDPDQRALAYRNQDFFVYLLRIGGLANVEKLLRSLTGAVIPGVGADTFTILEAYGAALDAGGVGLDTGFVELLGGYVAQRGFIREPEGHIWPLEPNGGPAGAMYMLDKSLFSRWKYSFDDLDCVEDYDSDSLECTATMEDVLPMAGALFIADLDELARSWDIPVEAVRVSASTDADRIAFWAAGELGGAGAAGCVVSGSGSAEIMVPDAATWSVVNVLVAQGFGEGDVTVSMRIEAGLKGLVYEGMGTVIDTYTPPGGSPGICTQSVLMTFDVDRLPDWVELSFTERNHEINYVGGNGTCELLDSTWDQSYWNNSHPAGSFGLASGSADDLWLTGTYDEDWASGNGIKYSGDTSRQVTFDLPRKR